MLVDVIILTNSTTFKNVRSTKRTIYTLRDSETKYNFNIILVESSINNENEYINAILLLFSMMSKVWGSLCVNLKITALLDFRVIFVKK